MRLYAATVALMLPLPTVAADYLGQVTSVADGDIFTMESETGKVRVRICGIDAPERGQPGYGQAAGVLANMIEGKVVHCLQSAKAPRATASRNLPAATALLHSAFWTSSTSPKKWQNPERPATGRSFQGGTTRSATAPARGNSADDSLS
jgi:hypothetical protein